MTKKKSQTLHTMDDKGFITAGSGEQALMFDIRMEEGTVFEGHYLRSKVVENPKFINGRAIIHEFLNLDGKIEGIFGSGQLDYRLKAVGEEAPGALTQITYLGKGEFKKKEGKKTITLPVHNYDVKFNPKKCVVPKEHRTSN